MSNSAISPSILNTSCAVTRHLWRDQSFATATCNGWSQFGMTNVCCRCVRVNHQAEESVFMFQSEQCFRCQNKLLFHPVLSDQINVCSRTRATPVQLEVKCPSLIAVLSRGCDSPRARPSTRSSTPFLPYQGALQRQAVTGVDFPATQRSNIFTYSIVILPSGKSCALLRLVLQLGCSAADAITRNFRANQSSQI